MRWQLIKAAVELSSVKSPHGERGGPWRGNVKQSAVLRRCSRPDPSTQSGHCSLSLAQGVWPRQGQWETKLLDAVGAVARVSGAQALDAGKVLDAGNRGRGTRGQAPRRCRGLAVLKHSSSTPLKQDRRCADAQPVRPKAVARAVGEASGAQADRRRATIIARESKALDAVDAMSSSTPNGSSTR